MALLSVLGIAASAQAQQERSLDCLSGTAPPHLSQALQSLPSAERFWIARRDALAWATRADVAANFQVLRSTGRDIQVFNQTLWAVEAYRKGYRPSSKANPVFSKRLEEHARTIGAIPIYAAALNNLAQPDAVEQVKALARITRELDEDFIKAMSLSASGSGNVFEPAIRMASGYLELRNGCPDVSSGLRSYEIEGVFPPGDYPSEIAPGPVLELRRIQQHLRGRGHQVNVLEMMCCMLSDTKSPGNSDFVVTEAYRQLAMREQPRVLAWLARASEAELQVFAPRRFDPTLPRAHEAYVNAMVVPAIEMGFEDRRIVLAGLSSSNSQPLSLTEKARANQPPTAADLLSLVTGLSMQSTGSTAGVQVSRVAHNQYSYTVPRFNTNGVTTVQIFSPRCQPEGKRQRCSFTYNNTMKENTLLGGSREGGSGSYEAEGLLYWTEAGLQSSDIPQLGWYRKSWTGGQPSAGSADDPIERRANERRKTDDYIRERTDREAEEREKRNRR